MLLNTWREEEKNPREFSSIITRALVLEKQQRQRSVT